MGHATPGDETQVEIAAPSRENFWLNFMDSLRQVEGEKAKERVVLHKILKTLSLLTHESSIKENTLAQFSKERFNILSCLTAHHLEELHSNFIAYLLDPQELHHCGSLFLELFLATLKIIPGIEEQLADVVLEVGSFQVNKEKYIGRSTQGDIYGFIDIYLESATLNIAIENKIKAGEQADQIKRYSQYCKTQGKRYLVLYLTLEGVGSLQAGDEPYYKLSYREHIVTWLETCIKETWKYPLVYAGIHYYQNLLKHNILHLPHHTTLMDIKDFLLKEENLLFLKYWEEIKAAESPITEHYRSLFFVAVAKELQKRQYQTQTVKGIVNLIPASEVVKTGCSGFIFTDPDYVLDIDQVHQLYFNIEHNKKALSFGLFGIKITEEGQRNTFLYGEKLAASKVMSKLSASIPGLTYSEYWLALKEYIALDKGNSFYSPSLNYDLATRMDEIVQEFVEQVEVYLAAWAEGIKQLKAEMEPAANLPTHPTLPS
ncbi:PD-(D/E)XK nuclease family protein [Pontibacter sp. HSC-14F20]|uniref:PDDEXK-like family protein n=1 Tax=Pontibacter sp. HSC-14F20 TaxID=2864136 RepID=UPI001C733B9A|nr:PD-(D/E)XK nuclease family protein [Pontibacter sp. HSC-14F20]MBX0332940.1 PD-(D/E)XK nuclease family protein [Pontibacter sp. HSC-14F20]